MRAISFGQDGSFSWEDLSARYQAELANGFGNLASRVIAMVTRYRGGVIPTGVELTGADQVIFATGLRVTAEADAAIERLAIHEALAVTWTLVDELNGYITIQEPWALSKDPARAERLDAVLYTIVRGLGTLAVLLSPVIPDAAATLWAALGGTGEVTDQDVRAASEWAGGPSVSPLPTSLFPRIEQPDTAV